MFWLTIILVAAHLMPGRIHDKKQKELLVLWWTWSRACRRNAQYWSPPALLRKHVRAPAPLPRHPERHMEQRHGQGHRPGHSAGGRCLRPASTRPSRRSLAEKINEIYVWQPRDPSLATLMRPFPIRWRKQREAIFDGIHQIGNCFHIQLGRKRRRRFGTLLETCPVPKDAGRSTFLLSGSRRSSILEAQARAPARVQ
jgi:hypothetical protein